MTKQTLKHFALSLAALGLLLSARPGLAQGKLAGLRQNRCQSPQSSQAARLDAYTSPPNSPSYSFSLFDFPQAPNTAGFGINNKFEIVGSYGATVPEGMGGNGFQIQFGVTKSVITSERFQTVDDPGEGVEQYANGINDSGQVAGGYYDASGNLQGYELSGGIFTPIAYPGAIETFSSGINNSGVIVGQWGPTGSAFFGFELSGTTYTSISFPGASGTVASGINNGGEIVGYYYDVAGVGHSFVLNGATYTSFDVPGATETLATGINDAGEIVGGYCTNVQCPDDQNTMQGFLLSKGVYTTISVPDSTSTIAFGINNKGVIVGSYGNCDTGGGLAHGFLAIP